MIYLSATIHFDASNYKHDNSRYDQKKGKSSVVAESYHRYTPVAQLYFGGYLGKWSKIEQKVLLILSILYCLHVCLLDFSIWNIFYVHKEWILQVFRCYSMKWCTLLCHNAVKVLKLLFICYILNFLSFPYSASLIIPQ